MPARAVSREAVGRSSDGAVSWERSRACSQCPGEETKALVVAALPGARSSGGLGSLRPTAGARSIGGWCQAMEMDPSGPGDALWNRGVKDEEAAERATGSTPSGRESIAGDCAETRADVRGVELEETAERVVGLAVRGGEAERAWRLGPRIRP